MKKPNILLLITDQQRHDTIACAHTGACDLRTPNFDRLAAGGLRFARAYSPNPVCIPARYNLLTGLTARFHGHADNGSAPLPGGIPCLPQILSEAGYLTHAVGKMHFQPMREHHGFHRMELMEETPRYRQDDDYLRHLQAVGCRVLHQHGVRHLLYHQPQRSLVPEEHHGTRWVADRAIDFLERNANGPRPFFLKASWIAPHPPENVPERLADCYVGARLPPRIPRVEQRPGREDILPTARATRHLGDGMVEGDAARLRRHQEHYHASLAFVDEQMGRVLDALDRLGVADETLVIATSDHGEMLGDLDCFQKSVPYEGASRIPLILRWPGRMAAGEVERERFADLNDILPTCLGAACLPYPGHETLPGSSLLDLSRGRDRTVQYVENGQGAKRWISWRDTRYKYVYAFYGGWEALFDLEHDPGEQCNLLVDGVPAELRPVRDRLFRQLVAHEERWGLPGGVAWKDLVRHQPYPLPSDALNTQYPPPWITTLSHDERRALGDPLDEIIAAVRSEPTVTLADLKLEHWAAKCGVSTEQIARIKHDKCTPRAGDGTTKSTFESEA
jgi:arylsulfatase